MGFQHAHPADGEEDVALDDYIAAVYLPPPFPGSGDTVTYTITSPGSQSSGAIDQGTCGNLLCRWTNPSLVNDTEYTWEFTTNFGESGGPFTFTTVQGAPSKPINPTPTNVATDIALSTGQVSWEDGGDADTYDVYFGPSGNMTLRSSAQAGLNWTLPTGILEDYNTVYQWRIDATNASGTTTGDTWSFTTLVFSPPVPSGDDDGGEFGGEGGKNIMRTVRRLLVAAANKIYYEDE